MRWTNDILPTTSGATIMKHKSQPAEQSSPYIKYTIQKREEKKTCKSRNTLTQRNIIQVICIIFHCLPMKRLRFIRLLVFSVLNKSNWIMVTFFSFALVVVFFGCCFVSRDFVDGSPWCKYCRCCHVKRALKLRFGFWPCALSFLFRFDMLYFTMPCHAMRCQSMTSSRCCHIKIPIKIETTNVMNKISVCLDLLLQLNHPCISVDK